MCSVRILIACLTSPPSVCDLCFFLLVASCLEVSSRAGVLSLVVGGDLRCSNAPSPGKKHFDDPKTDHKGEKEELVTVILADSFLVA